MLRFAFYFILIILLTRALSRLWAGVMEGLHGQSAGARAPQLGVQMVRDPVCGTFVVPDKSITLSIGRERLYFCSTACRDHYLEGQSGRVEGKTA